jgi:hypothetical protein
VRGKRLWPLLFCLGLAVAAIVCLFLVKGGDFQAADVFRPPDSSAYSPSAVGNLLFHDVLKEAGYKVERRLGDGGLNISDSEFLIITKGEILPDSSVVVEDLSRAGKVLIVLPKWNVLPDPSRRGWVKEAELSDFRKKFALLFYLFPQVRDSKRLPDLNYAPGDAAFKGSPGGVKPFFADEIQLISGKGVKPLIHSAEGSLLAEIELPEGKKAWILSDPDVLNNRGILKGDNLAFSLELVRDFTGGPDKGTVVFFEPDLAPARASGPGLKRLFRLPELTALLLSLLSALLFALFGLKRFWPENEPEEEEGFGNRRLIRNSARLVASGGKETEIFRRYLKMETIQLGRLLKAPTAIVKDQELLKGYLEQALVKRGLGGAALKDVFKEPSESAGRPAAGDLLARAETLHRFKEALESGPGGIGKTR